MSPMTARLVELLLPPILALLIGFRPVSGRRVARFAAEYDIALTSGTQPILSVYLARTSRWRAAGGAIGWLAASAFTSGSGYHYFLGVAGYLAGALAAEIGTSLPMPEGRRRAALMVRKPGERLTWWAHWGPVLIVTALGVHTWLYQVWPKAGHTKVAPSQIILDLAGIGLATAVMWLSCRFIVMRPWPVRSLDLDAADDGIRASSLQTIAGASLALMCLATLDAMWAMLLDLDAPEPFNWVMSVLGFAMVLAALYSWFGIRTRPRPAPKVPV
ncbi:hypothetical protein OHA77_33665 [Streptosporangium sp. NBC_01639]|uniref:hypothetical protein n=1 Tax=Streptosporangium sp. NBC_01639 TaxID=2975948 RepID=UPI00386C6B98|nr:hypothetical protein OHA77_33665 [Streptosporangium sp. NBC_01639]